ncbi:LuxR C-terminal-related transcriptional regulator [Qipengyuania spongiae]|uniref:LuxR C-terminal-related transcriptional regulator n=1 Tax=Qipengyuania spongiae TaxID=2909673 RepID=A0ABY5SY72_9SPHN|nr:LuxR C-terminal-related transcriptional regulator [Qipengyuania spongiae]UVI39493.1 LuxR C-terminal-related transcriptional regulator [Qipengyuania spongiae]
MDGHKFLIVDTDYQKRNSLAQALSQKGYVVQVDNVAELGNPSFDQAFVFVADALIADGKTCRALQEAGIFYPVIAYGPAPSLSRVIERLHGPCAGYVAWPGEEDEVWNTLTTLIRTSAVEMRRRTTEARARRKMAQLTPRERQVALGIRDGLSSKELAIPLGISFRTVELHRANIMEKFGTSKISTVMRIIVEAGEMDGFGDDEGEMVSPR